MARASENQSNVIRPDSCAGWLFRLYRSQRAETDMGVRISSRISEPIVINARSAEMPLVGSSKVGSFLGWGFEDMT